MAKERFCIECLLAWLMYGDGAECLAGHGRVYRKVKPDG